MLYFFFIRAVPEILCHVNLPLERFLIEGRKRKLKVITTADQNKGKYYKESMRTQNKYTQPV